MGMPDGCLSNVTYDDGQIFLTGGRFDTLLRLRFLLELTALNYWAEKAAV